MIDELALPGTLPALAPVAPLRPAAVLVRPQGAFFGFRRLFGAWFLFLTVTLPIYAPALGGQFMWDDNHLTQGDPFIRSPLFCLEAFRHTLFGDQSRFYRPAQTLSYIFDYWCWGLEPFGYHLTNVIIHAANGFGLFLLLSRVLPVLVPTVGPATAPRAEMDRAALSVALLWTLHPVHSAAVAYVSGRADSLAMAFCLMAWLACERALAAARPAPRIGWWIAAFVGLLLGLCSKEIAFVWLVLFGGWLFAVRPDPAGATPRAILRTKLAVVGGGLLALACYLGLRCFLVPPHPPTPLYPAMPAKWLLMLRALGDYGRLMLFPDQLYMERQVFPAPGLANPQTPAYYTTLAVVGAFVLVAFGVGAWLPGRGHALRRAGIAWFLVGFLPVSNLFKLNASVAEHWLYLPSIGFLLFLAGVGLDVPWTHLSSRFAQPRVAVVVVCLAAAALGGRTWLRAHDWVDGVTFYRQTIRDGGDFPRMRENLALTYLEHGDLTPAATLLSDIVARYPHLSITRVNLATIQARAGHTEEARATFERVAADLNAPNKGGSSPREFIATIHALDKLEPVGDPTWAQLRRDLLGRAARRFPEVWDLVGGAIADRERAKDQAGVLALTSRFADEHWWHLPSHLALGKLLADADRPDEALMVWRQAMALDLRDASVPAAVAALYLAQGRLAQAVAWQQKAVHRQPDSLRQHLILAQIFERSGRPDDAGHERVIASQILREAGEGETNTDTPED